MKSEKEFIIEEIENYTGKINKRNLLKLIDTVFIEIDEEQLIQRLIQNDKVYEKLALILDPLNHKMAA